ncbi:outer membrane protein with beta-barrel domain [Flavobacterium sp. 90]|uniref:outer membrane beta-barrel protein n=1 Tax=unclassified Flavobacterium TaxID=196869 RepID=UPI000EB52904|nr:MULTISPECIES: outer membrane beta-barrel protein [unclassified Flavobacterium]RKR10385.1 outer membrane protein with beta-barrel domain [Flavobacterium sp. 81]TCK54170.1 outer membrane protein with beta-barrel domain [Flavobacterium sp. 90]
MKNQTLLFISALLFNLSIYSQAPRGFYASAGFSQTNLKSSDLLTKSKPGFFVGINGLMGYHENYNFQLEFAYKQNTLDVKYVEDTFEEVKKSKYKYSELNLGFYFNYYILKPEEDEFFLGPQVGAFLAVVDPLAPYKGTDVNDQLYLPYLLNESDLTNSAKYNYGFGFGLTGGYNNFRFDLRYSLSMANVLKDVQVHSYDESNNYTGPTLEGKASTISFGVSYNIFHFKK